MYPLHHRDQPGHDSSQSDSDNLALFYFLRKQRHHAATGGGCLGIIVMVIVAGVAMLSR